MLQTINRRFLATLLFISLVPLAIVGAVILRFERQALLEQSTRELETVSMAVARDLDVYVDELLHDAAVMASLPELTGMDGAKQQVILEHLYHQSGRYGQLAVIDLSSQILLTARPQELITIEHIDSFRRAATGVQSWVVAPALFSDNLVLHMHTPLVYESGETAAVLGSPSPLGNLVPFLTEFDLGAGSDVFVLGDDDRVLVHRDNDVQLARPSFADIFQIDLVTDGAGASNDLGARVDSGSVIVELDGEPTLVVYTRVNRLGWTVVAKRPLAEAVAASSATLRVTLISLGVMVVLSGGVAIVSARRLTKPIERLATAAVALEAGLGTVALPEVGSRDQEIGQLIRAFSSMQKVVIEREENLRQLSLSLEERVQLRTAELQESNKELALEIQQHKHTLASLQFAKERAEEASQAKSAFLSTVSHEMRTPLNAVIGYAELLSDEELIGTDIEIKNDVDAIIKSSRHLLKIINDILRFVQIQSKQIPIKIERFQIKALLNDVVLEMIPLLDENGNDLIVTNQMELAWWESDREKVQQILQNLVGNAAKFTNEGRIELVTKRKKSGDEELLCFAVIDSGIGISVENLDLIFDPFVQKTIVHGRAGGIGLGLTIARSYCERLGGSIFIDSVAGEGTSVEVSLPLHGPASLSDGTGFTADMPHK